MTDQPQPITTAAELEALCARLADAAWVALDTEFMRTNTYRAQLCLIQLATPNFIACVDPLALGDLNPLYDVLYRPNMLNVLHAARQDIEVLYDQRGMSLPAVFDTQIAAALVGYDDQIGYSALVEAITGHKLEKLEARTDWAARPLTSAQLRYAEDDVRYLREIYPFLDARVRELGRADWLAEECAALSDPQLYRSDPTEAWRRLGAGATLTPSQQTVLVALAQWREQEAQKRDLPRGWVVSDAALVEIARFAPTSIEALTRIKDMKPPIIRRSGEALLELVQRAHDIPAKTWWDNPERLDQDQMELVKRLSTRVKEKAQAEKVSAALVAPRREVIRLIRRDQHCTLLRGWRRAFIGDELLALCTRG